MSEAKRSTWRLLLLGLVFHVAYIPIVFDCYFKSPVINGMRHFAPNVEPPAKRLVLLVGDGLRADLLYNLNPFPHISNSPRIIAPYLRNIMEKRGAFGISHTRVPTESRPGHVAIIAGMYEDVSAVTKGWKTNPVDFDSVFNQSSATFSFGSPDILPMFARGAVSGHVHMWCYDESEEDFTKDATTLDEWSYNGLATLLNNATRNPSGELYKALHEPRVVFFLHLLGLDTTGHAFRPHSKEYMRNIEVVDMIVQRTEKLLDEFYAHDGKTAFVFTADHGMSNIGNHGDGDPDSTRTPLVAWGSGIRGPLPDNESSSHDDYSSSWGLSRLLRTDVNQADIAPLMSSLIGGNWAVNSVGVLPDIRPDRIGFLAGDDKQKAKLGLVNAQVILEQYRLKEQRKASASLHYTPFQPLHVHGSQSTSAGESQVRLIEDLLSTREWNTAREQAAQLIDVALEGLRYLQTYDWFLLRATATFGYIGWSAYAICHILNASQIATHRPELKLDSFFVNALFIGITAVASFALFLQSSPVMYYVYVSFPTFFWHRVAQTVRRSLYSNTPQERQKSDSTSFGRRILWCAMTILALESMVVGYTQRSIWSIGFLILGIIWPLSNWNHPYLLIQWTFLCLITAIFPALSVEKSEDIRFVACGAVVQFLVGVDTLRRLGPNGHGFKRLASQTLLIAAAGIVTVSSAKNIEAKRGLPRPNQVAGWLILVGSLVIPFLHRKAITDANLRLRSYFLGFAPLFVILSIREEGLFYTSFTLLVCSWADLEPNLANKPKELSKAGTRTLQFSDTRIALIFLFLVQVAFFGTGNVASISSFYLEPVYRLVPIFSPFLMASLLIIKIIAPYIILSAAFANLNHKLLLPPFSLFMIALSLTDVMTLTFFYRVRDQGSWLEIGQTISFFIISSLLLVWSGGICSAGQWLMSGALHPLKPERTAKRPKYQ